MTAAIRKKLSIEDQAHALALFNVLPAKAGRLDARCARYGFIPDFKPDAEQLELLKRTFKPIDLTTLFSLTEAAGDPEQLLLKQVLHYIEVYGLDRPGLFNLEVTAGRGIVLRFIKAVTLMELSERVSRLINANAPVADVEPVAALVRALRVPYDVNKLPNRELRVALFDPHADVFESGDDAARWLCWRATGNALLIKNEATIEKIGLYATALTLEEGSRGSGGQAAELQAFLSSHVRVLARVFNRHKRLLVPLKGAGVKAGRLINRISRLSKTEHVPLQTPAARTVIARTARGEDVDLSRTSLRDRFRYLNLIEYKLLGLPTDAFSIRNGKIWTALDRPVLDPHRLAALREQVLAALKSDLTPLANQRILLDERVDFGLPISRKQTLGNLPFGTTLRVDAGRKISVGIYWHNEWGASDLDLSAISPAGERVGWGDASSYGRSDVTFSGDVTDARNGACEFITLDPSVGTTLGLLVNIFQGGDAVKAEIIAGYPTRFRKKKMFRDYAEDEAVAASWQDHTLLREKIDLKSRQTLLGFVRGDKFVIYSGRLGSDRVSRSGVRQPVVDRGQSDLWTVGKLFDAAGIPYDVRPRPGVEYAHDLRYASFSLDRLERMFESGNETGKQTSCF